MQYKPIWILCVAQRMCKAGLKAKNNTYKVDMHHSFSGSANDEHKLAKQFFVSRLNYITLQKMS